MNKINKISLNFKIKGIDCVKMQSDKYTAIIAPTMGAAVLRLHDDENDIEVFRYREDVTAEDINNQREVWGLPTLYLPNRFDRGIVRTSDDEYHLPVNETKFDNHLHGWVHLREHDVECYSEDDGRCVLVTSYTFNSKDEMYKYFPVDFKISYTFTLSEHGLLQEIYLTDNSDKALPVSICTHTCLNAPMCVGGRESTMRMCIPVGEKCGLTDRFLSDEKFYPLTDWDMEYKNGSKVPTGQVIENDMYKAEMNTYKGKPFYGSVITDTANGHVICNEISKEFKFWNMWNDQGEKGYFCPEPMTALINAPNLKLPRSVSGYTELKKGQTFKCWQRFFTE